MSDIIRVPRTVFENQTCFSLTSNPKKVIVIEMKKLLELQTNLEEIFRDYSNIAVIIKDNYNFSYLNRLGINLLGYRENEILEMSLIELLTPDFLESFIENVKLLRETGFSQPFLIDVLKKNGEIASLELSGVKLDDGRFFFTGRNISLETSRKQRIEDLEESNKNILNSIGEGIVVLDLQGNVLKFNDFMQKTFPWKKAEIIGTNIFKLNPEFKDQGLLESFVKIIDEGCHVKRENIIGIGPGGKQYVLNLRGYPLRKGKNIKGVVIIVEDISRNKEFSRKIERAVDTRTKIHQIIESIISANTIPEIIERLISGLKEKLDYDRGGVFLAEIDKKSLSIGKLFSSVNTTKELNKAGTKIKKGIDKGKGVTAKVFRTGKPKIINDIKKEKNSLIVFPDTKSEMAVPIRIKDETIGVVTVVSRKKNVFDETDLRFVEMLANGVAITIKKTQVYEDLIKNLQFLSTIYETGQVLQGFREGKIDNGKVLKQVSLHLPGFIILVLRFNNERATKIIATLNTPKGIRKIFAGLSKENQKIIVKKVKKGSPFISVNMKRNQATLLYELYKEKIRNLYIFPFFSGNKVTGCLVLLSHQHSTLQKDQIPFLTAIANQLSSSLQHSNRSIKRTVKR